MTTNAFFHHVLKIGAIVLQGFESYKEMSLAQDQTTREFILKDFETYFPEDKQILADNTTQVFSNTDDHGTTRDFVVNPSTKTYFYQWKVPEFKGQEGAGRNY